MARLPKVGSDENSWGSILNEFLTIEHNTDGTLKQSGTLANKQPLSPGLTAISEISATNGDIMQYKAGRWSNRTVGQVKADLAITRADVALDHVDNTADTDKPVSNAVQNALKARAAGAPYVRTYNRNNYKHIYPTHTGWSDHYGTGTVGYDTSDRKVGSASVKLVTPADATTACGMKQAFGSPLDWRKKTLKLWLKVDDWTKLGEVYLVVSTSGSFTSSFRFNLRPFLTYPTQYNGQWVELVVPQHRAVVQSGTPDWSNVNGLMLKAYGTSGISGTVRFNEIAVIDNPGQGMVSITFDDGHVSQFTDAKPILDFYGYKATNFTIPDYIGTTGYMTQAQTDTLAEIGWDISGHHQTNLTTMTTNQVHDAMQSVRSYLNGHGYKGGDLFAYPNGGENPTVNPVVQQYFSAGRTIVDAAQPINYVNPMRISSRILHNTDSLSTVKDWVDSALVNNEWLILCFHKIVPAPASSIDWPTSDFQSLIDYIHSKGVPVLPMSDALSKATLSTVPSGGDTSQLESDVALLARPTARWVRPYHNGIAATDSVPVSGRVMLYMVEVQKACTVDALVFVNGSVASGNVRVGLYGPVAFTTDTCASTALIAQSASIAVTAVNAPQAVPFSAPVPVVAGKYYVAISHDNTTNRYMRVANQSQVVGWVQYFDQPFAVLPGVCPSVTETGAGGHGLTVRCSA